MEQAAGPEVVGDSQDGQLELLAAALTSPLPEQHQTGRHGTHSAVETDAASPPPTARGPAAAAFVAQCRRLGAEAHPQLLHSLNRLDAEAYAPLTLHQRPGEGERVCRPCPRLAALLKMQLAVQVC